MLGRPALSCRQFDDPVVALGRAVDLLRRVQPFASYTFGRLSSVLSGEIKRQHYVFTFDGRAPVGYAGWALCDEPIARAWIEERHVPSFAECSDGDSWVGITFYAASKEACLFQARWCRARYPGLKAFGIRDYGRRSRRTEVKNAEPTLSARKISQEAFGHGPARTAVTS